MTDIYGYEGLYAITRDGRVWSYPKTWKGGKGKHNGIWLKRTIDSQGYVIVKLCRGDKNRKQYVHRLVAESFILNPNNLPQINHKNGIKTDNRVENLEWVTAKENIRHGWSTGLNVAHKGERASRAKLSLVQVLAIRHLLKQGMTHQKIGDQFNVGRATITAINMGVNWKS